MLCMNTKEMASRYILKSSTVLLEIPCISLRSNFTYVPSVLHEQCLSHSLCEIQIKLCDELAQSERHPILSSISTRTPLDVHGDWSFAHSFLVCSSSSCWVIQDNPSPLITLHIYLSPRIQIQLNIPLKTNRNRLCFSMYASHRYPHQ